MTPITDLRPKTFNRETFAALADWLVVAVAVSLPWSTSATSIIIALWLLAILPGADVALFRRELASAAGALPVLLWVLAAVGMAWASWADVTWRERLVGLYPYHRLLLVPVLLAYFRRSAHGMRVLRFYLASVAALLAASWALVLFPHLSRPAPFFGVVVKDYIIQSEQFLICAVVLLAFAGVDIRARRFAAAAPLVVLAVLFFANILFVSTGRTTLLIIPVLALMLAWRELRWRGVFGVVLAAAIVVPAVWFGSSYLRERLEESLRDFQVYMSVEDLSSTARHLEFIRKSISFVETAPLFGHGTGSIPEQFRNSVAGQTGAAAIVSVNPHNQIFAVAIQLGLLGAAVLVAMWAAHLRLFVGPGLYAFIGLVIVVQSVVASLFNSYLFNFGEGWLYVFGVGILGGMVLRERDSTPMQIECPNGFGRRR